MLKTVAWQMRGSRTDKDATDLVMLLECVDAGDYEERCWDGRLLERFDGDPGRVGAFLAGRDAMRDLPKAVRHCASTWRSTELRYAMSRHELERERLGEQLAAFGEGASALRA